MRVHCLSVLGMTATVVWGLGCDEVLDRIEGDASGDAALAVSSVALTEAECATLIAVVDDLEFAETEGQIASLVADAAATTFSPDGCVFAEAVGGTVSYIFDNCSGPRGLSGLNGTALVTFAVPADFSVAVTLTATDFEANGTSVTLSAQGEYSAGANGQEVVLTTSGGGITDDGEILSRGGSYNATWSDTCVTIEGGWTTQVGETNYTTALTAYTSCEGACPADGGRVVLTESELDAELNGAVTTVSYGGDGSASYISTAGTPGTVTLSCP